MDSRLPSKRPRLEGDEPMEVDEGPSTSGLQNVNLVNTDSDRISDSDDDSTDGEDPDFDRVLEENEVMMVTTRDSSRRKEARMTAVTTIGSFVEIENAFGSDLRTFYLKVNPEAGKDPCIVLTYYKDNMIRVISQQINELGAIKFNILVECTYIKQATKELQDRAFKTRNVTVLTESDLNRILLNMFKKIRNEEVAYEGRGSGWSLVRVDGLLMRINKYAPLGGSAHLPLPQKIVRKKAVINPLNQDEYCFKWAVLCHFVKGKNRGRIDRRYHVACNLFNFSGIDFPTPVKQIDKFEQMNPDTSINVYGLNDFHEVYPVRITSSEKRTHIDLLVLTDNQEADSHYCYISDFNRLVRPQMTKHAERSVYCRMCLTKFRGPKMNKRLNDHKTMCRKNKAVRALMPELYNGEPEMLKFKNVQNQLKLPIVLYADFECLLKPVDEQVSTHTVVDNVHEPMSFCVYAACVDELPDLIRDVVPEEPYLYRGPGAAERFMAYVVQLTNTIGDVLKNNNVPMIPLTPEEVQRLRSTDDCEMCERPFNTFRKRCRDHCHLTGRFRSVLCNDCNLRRQNQKSIPVLIHGSSNYDSHFIVRQLGYDKRRINVIPNSTEKYITFSKQTASGVTVRFIDTYKIMNCNLATLVNNLPNDKFVRIRSFFDEQDLPLVTRKGVYPYEYTSSWEKLDEIELPSKENFRNTLLGGVDISDADYNHARNVWDHFGITTLGEYSDLYLKLDVLLLCDVFENFRELCLESYNLDCAHYLTLPSFTFDAMLKYTGVELELLSDYNMYLFVENGIRGGITSCVTRNAKANNPYMGADYDPNVDHSYLMYLDCNNLYGWAMTRPMPVGDFRWYTGDVNKIDVRKMSPDSKIGCFLEVDVDYPQTFHDEHDDLPFLPVSECPPRSKHKKLLTTLESKKNYICHCMNLKQALENGLILKKIHRVLLFRQSQWLKGYIDFNTERRQRAQNAFEKDFYKLLNNSMFGKTIENIRKRLKLELVTSRKRLRKLIAKPTFEDRIIYDESLCAVQSAKEAIFFNKPIYVGFSVLELSKTKMYEFHYKIMKPRYGSRIKVLYMDTDAFFYQIFTEDFYNDLKNDPEFMNMFDTSDYPADHMCYSAVNKKVLGKFKDECNGIIIIEFVGLRPKLYCFRTPVPLSIGHEKNKEPTVQKKAKGVTKSVVDRDITFSDYKNCLGSDISIRKQIKLFNSKKHVIRTITCNKVSLSSKDDKRVICENGIDTRSYGHYRLSENLSHDSSSSSSSDDE